jgi:hypothetical protein
MKLSSPEEKVTLGFGKLTHQSKMLNNNCIINNVRTGCRITVKSS